jgi:hypothetical protein
MVAEASQIFLRDAQVLPKWLGYDEYKFEFYVCLYDEYCRRERWQTEHRLFAVYLRWELLILLSPFTTSMEEKDRSYSFFLICYCVCECPESFYPLSLSGHHTRSMLTVTDFLFVIKLYEARKLLEVEDKSEFACYTFTCFNGLETKRINYSVTNVEAEWSWLIAMSTDRITIQEQMLKKIHKLIIGHRLRLTLLTVPIPFPEINFVY